MAERAVVGDLVLVQLKHSLDAGEPQLEARVLRSAGYLGGVWLVTVTSPHPVWRGCELSSGHYRVLERITQREQCDA